MAFLLMPSSQTYNRIILYAYLQTLCCLFQLNWLDPSGSNQITATALNCPHLLEQASRLSQEGWDELTRLRDSPLSVISLPNWGLSGSFLTSRLVNKRRRDLIFKTPNLPKFACCSKIKPVTSLGGPFPVKALVGDFNGDVFNMQRLAFAYA